MQTRLFLVDDHEIVRRGLRELFETEDDLQIVGEAATAEEAIGRIPATQPDVAVLDVRLPDGDGIEVCREIRSRHQEIACLMLTSFADDEAVGRRRREPFLEDIGDRFDIADPSLGQFSAPRDGDEIAWRRLAVLERGGDVRGAADLAAVELQEDVIALEPQPLGHGALRDGMDRTLRFFREGGASS